MAKKSFSKAVRDNRSVQLNSNNPTYHSSRGTLQTLGTNSSSTSKKVVEEIRERLILNNLYFLDEI